jgi:hypothetical protein
VSPYLLTMALEPIPGLAQYQIAQIERDLLRVRAIGAGGADVQMLESEIVCALRGALPSSLRVEAEIVDRLEHGPRAKVRSVQPLPRSTPHVMAGAR